MAALAGKNLRLNIIHGVGTWSRPTCDLQPVGIWQDPRRERNLYSKLRLIGPVLCCTSLWQAPRSCLRQDMAWVRASVKRKQACDIYKKGENQGSTKRGVGSATELFSDSENVTANPGDATPCEINASFSSSSQLSLVKGQLMSTLFCYRQIHKFPGKNIWVC